MTSFVAVEKATPEEGLRVFEKWGVADEEFVEGKIEKLHDLLYRPKEEKLKN